LPKRLLWFNSSNVVVLSYDVILKYIFLMLLKCILNLH
jgi:hypothetical protein